MKLAMSDHTTKRNYAYGLFLSFHSPYCLGIFSVFGRRVDLSLARDFAGPTAEQ